MTQNSKLTQPNGDPNLCSKRAEDVTQPSQPDTKKLSAEPKKTCLRSQSYMNPTRHLSLLNWSSAPVYRGKWIRRPNGCS
jgi:hypothetical protein